MGCPTGPWRPRPRSWLWAVWFTRIVAEYTDLTVRGDYWFDRLRGVAHFFTGDVGPSQIRGKQLSALPNKPYFLLVLTGPQRFRSWRRLEELDRLAEALQLASADERLELATVDCFFAGNEDFCREFLGDPWPVRPLWFSGVNAPLIGHLAFGTLGGAWPDERLPLLLLGDRDDFLAVGHGGASRRPIVQAQAFDTAEETLEWVVRTRVEVLGHDTLSQVTLASPANFRRSLLRLREERAGHQATLAGCQCKGFWRLCSPTLWSAWRPEDRHCRVVHGCAEEGFCDTEWPCGPQKKSRDACLLEPAELPEPPHVDEADVVGGVAFWLHEIFQNHPFELRAQDPKQSRRKAFVDLLQLLCSYFPDHLERSVVPGLPLEKPASGCRESLCHLGGMMQEERFWRRYTEIVDVAMEAAPPETAEAPPDPPLLARRTRVRRIRWRKLERDWQLCGIPWRRIGQRGWAQCKGQDPLARGFPCGAWSFLHALLTEGARTHDCKYAGKNASDTDQCVGPSTNTTLQELEAIKREREDERVKDLLLMEEAMERNATLPKEFHLAPTDKPHYCITVNEKLGRVNQTLAWNATAIIVLTRVHDALGYDVVEGRLEHMSGASLKDSVPVRLELSKVLIGPKAGLLPTVTRISEGPPEFNRTWSEGWKLTSIGGAPLLPSADWKGMLLHSLPGETRLLLMGEPLCVTGHPWCDWDCATFSVERVVRQEGMFGGFGKGEAKRKHIDAPHGVIRDKRTGYCYSRSWSRDWLFRSVDMGVDLVDCGRAEEYVLRQTSFLQNDVWCSRRDPKDCIANIYQTKPMGHAKFVGVDRVATVHAAVTSSREMVRRVRQTVLLFFPCATCRELFGSFELKLVDDIQHPKDAVLWLWRAHNNINLHVATGRVASQFPIDNGTTKSLWPPRSLCPECYCRPDPALDANQQEWKCPNGFDEDQVYHFLVSKYYTSDSAREERFERSELKLERAAAKQLEAERETDLQQAWSPAEMAIVGGRAERAPPEPPAGLVALAAAALLLASAALLALKPASRHARSIDSDRSAALCRDARGAYQPCGPGRTLLIEESTTDGV